jgi:hypothetical protein
MSNLGSETPSGDLFGDYPDVDQRECRLLGPTALVCAFPYYPRPYYERQSLPLDSTSFDGSLGNSVARV